MLLVPNWVGIGSGQLTQGDFEGPWKRLLRYSDSRQGGWNKKEQGTLDSVRM